MNWSDTTCTGKFTGSKLSLKSSLWSICTNSIHGSYQVLCLVQKNGTWSGSSSVRGTGSTRTGRERTERRELDIGKQPAKTGRSCADLLVV
ncbi:hypothetical protein LINPERPRIM_LOCUS9382 [Linum perenne]